MREPLSEYSQMAPVCQVARRDYPGDGIPSQGCIEATRTRWLANARCARKLDWFPSSEPEVLMEATHTLERCAR